MNHKSSKRRRYPKTRELVRIALADGMTQVEIAELCRVKQSIVSGWKNGKMLAWDSSIAALLEQYGHKLSRRHSELYLTEPQSTSVELWQTEAGQQLKQLIELKRDELVCRLEVSALMVAGQRLAKPSVAPNDKQPEATVAKRVRCRRVNDVIFGREADEFDIEGWQPTELWRRNNKSLLELMGQAEIRPPQLEATVPLTDLLTWSAEGQAEADIVRHLTGVISRIERLQQQLQERSHKPFETFAHRFLGIGGGSRLSEEQRAPWSLPEAHRYLLSRSQHMSVVEVVGQVIFRHVFNLPSLWYKQSRHGASYKVGKHPVRRWIVHMLSDGRLVLVRQQRRRLSGLDKQRWKAQVVALNPKCGSALNRMDESIIDFNVSSDEDAGRWLSTVEQPVEAEELREFVRCALSDHGGAEMPHDELTLPYLLDRALVRSGIRIQGLLTIDRTTRRVASPEDKS